MEPISISSQLFTGIMSWKNDQCNPLNIGEVSSIKCGVIAFSATAGFVLVELIALIETVVYKIITTIFEVAGLEQKYFFKDLGTSSRSTALISLVVIPRMIVNPRGSYPTREELYRWAFATDDADLRFLIRSGMLTDSQAIDRLMERIVEGSRMSSNTKTKVEHICDGSQFLLKHVLNGLSDKDKKSFVEVYSEDGDIISFILGRAIYFCVKDQDLSIAFFKEETQTKIAQMRPVSVEDVDAMFSSVATYEEQKNFASPMMNKLGEAVASERQNSLFLTRCWRLATLSLKHEMKQQGR